MQLEFELQRRPTNDDNLKQTEKRWVVDALGEPTTNAKDSAMDIEGGDSDWLEKVVRAADSLSFADAEVARKVETRIQVRSPFVFCFNEHQLIAFYFNRISTLVPSRLTQTSNKVSPSSNLRFSIQLDSLTWVKNPRSLALSKN